MQAHSSLHLASLIWRIPEMLNEWKLLYLWVLHIANAMRGAGLGLVSVDCPKLLCFLSMHGSLPFYI